MVLFKRKPVQFLPHPDDIDDSTEVRTDTGIWHISQTGEVFATYEDYLNRMDFYKQRRFICQITGHSGLNFFEALQSELAGAKEVEQSFPEALKGPILRRVQFQTVSRIDTLVDMIYEEFNRDYYPGENVTVHVVSGERLQGVVRDKTRFGSKVLPDGTLTEPFSRYFVSLDSRPDEEAVVDDTHIWRDRKVFTKSVLRSFIKKTVTREAWNGAPWLVKHDVAAEYHIDTRIPPHLRYDTKLLERKQVQAQKKLVQPLDINGLNSSFSGPVRLPELRAAPKTQKSKQAPTQLAQQGHTTKGKQHPYVKSEGRYMQIPLSANGFEFPNSLRDSGTPPVYSQPEPPPPPPPKYPIEDLQLEPRDVVRPLLKFMCNDPPVQVDSVPAEYEKIRMKSVGPLLETWDTLNVYCEIFKLDSFTFDDYVQAMLVASEETPVQLFDEIHCSVLKVLVSSEADGGNVEIKLPEIDEDEEEDEEEEEEEEEEAEPEPKPAARATRSSMAKLEAERLAEEAAAAEKENQSEPALIHRAEEALQGFDWIEQLRKREFKDGGWELIMVGLLHQLSKNERHTAACEELLAQIVPPDVEATQETVRQHYAALDINYRVQALQIICMLTAETKAFRGYMEDCSETMTAYRKEKIEWQRQRKQAIEELKALNDQRKILLPENMPPSPPQEATKVNGDVKMSDADDLTPAEEIADTEDEVPVKTPRSRGLRRAEDRALERKRKREEEQERKEKAEAAAKVPKQSKQFIKILKDIEKKEDFIKKCEDEVATIDNDLREADCPRTRVLGKDRFWNRYYWFERNGMPYGGLPNSSTADAGYANGCVWVQGPDEMEREGYIDMPDEFQNEYKAKFNMTVPERKKLEEGPTSVYNARQWGYIAEPEQLDALIHWLDPRGFNELKLRKELVAFHDKITQNMKNRKTYLNIGDETKEEDGEKKEEEEKAKASKRMSTRTRAVQTPEPPSYRCLKWENTMAVEELGHLHSEQPPPPPPGRARKQSRKKQEVVVDPEPSPEPPRKRTRRQGAR
ncbi:uncharacterized protein E0L32_005515 [Thyridium curvatum]|uniref:Uncharacterized protein n=1 Tax=Thyridium curvatum TaxID=1093900 RepID=A0A507BAA8_9PEZI|nr:uncharacterized protein E0L32_005515 [Thyridium curvatum]TPX14319.1 hypothetical protein E0L32_005515 [Thyridium curvatum]